MAFVPPAWFATLFWSQRDGDQDDPQAPLLAIRPGEHDCDETARRRIWKQFEAAASWETLLGLVIGPTFQVIEQGIGSVDIARYLSTAEGTVLEEIGALIGRPQRFGLSDDLYRIAIRTDGATLFTSGVVPEVIEIAQSLFGDQVVLDQFYPATFVLTAPDIDVETFLLLMDIMSDVPAAGVAGLLSTFETGTVGWWDSTLPDDVLIPSVLGTWDTTIGVATALSHWKHIAALRS